MKDPKDMGLLEQAKWEQLLREFAVALANLKAANNRMAKLGARIKRNVNVSWSDVREEALLIIDLNDKCSDLAEKIEEVRGEQSTAQPGDPEASEAGEGGTSERPQGLADDSSRNTKTWPVGAPAFPRAGEEVERPDAEDVNDQEEEA